MCQILASEDAHSPDAALGGFPSTGEGDTGQTTITKVATDTENSCSFGVKPWLPFPDPHLPFREA